MDNDPADLPGYVAGQSLNVSLDDVIDWMAVFDRQPHAGFTVKAMDQIQKQK